MLTPSTTLTSDLLFRLNQGEAAAIHLLVERCRERFRRRARQMLGDFPKLRGEVDTSDVEQELHVRLVKKLAEVQIKDARHFFRLANMTLRYFLIDWARKHKAVEALDAQGERDREPRDPGAGPVRRVMVAEIHQWIGTLEDKHQEIFDLIYYQELTEEEAGRVIGKSRKVVRRLVRELKLGFVEKFGEDFSGNKS